MRLTLRTMLAFMDDILEAEDAQKIGKKIEDSDTATGLLHRIRDVMRRLRLGAPNVKAEAAGLDPNTVAEYLDNTLSADRVPDFEKVCLESDVQLAEVASCHQILTLVLGEPAEVEPAGRQRMYQLPEVVAAQVRAGIEAAESAMAQEQPADGPTTQPRRDRLTVPDYLRDAARKRRLWPLAVAVLLVLVLGMGVLAKIGWFQPGLAIANLLGLGSEEESVALAPEAVGPEEEPAGAQPPETEPPAEPVAGPETPGVQAPPAASPGPGDGSPGEGGPSGAQPSAEDLAGVNPPVGPGIAEPAGPREPPIPGPGPGGEVPGVPPAVPPVEGIAEPGEGAGPQPPPEPAPLPPEHVGQLDSPTEILLRYDTDTTSWEQLPDQEPVISQDRLLSLPTYRPSIVLTEAMRLDLVGSTRIQMQPTDPQGIPGVIVEHGRLVIATTPMSQARLRLQFGDRSGVVRFGDSESILAVHATRAYGSNLDPETQPAPLTVDLYVAKGKILWQEGADREPVAVNAPVRLTLNEQPLEAVAVQRFPDWIVSDTTSPLDQRASDTLLNALTTGGNVFLVLRELAGHRQREVRWLALRCLASIGDFRLLVDGLDDPDQKPVWPDYIDQLRTAVRHSPLAAAQVRTAMERRQGPEGASLYELLWRYGDEGLPSEDAARLVQYLDHNTLAFRVVSFWNLKRITGLGLYYQPEDTAAKRQAAIRKWKERLNSSPLLRPKTPPEVGEPGASQTPPMGEGVLPGDGVE